MTPLLLVLLLACGGPATTTPQPGDVSAEGPDKLEGPPDTDAATNILPVRVDAGIAALPETATCPKDPKEPGPDSCFREVPGGTLHRGAQAADPAAPGYDPAARADEAPVVDVVVGTFWLQRNEVLASHVAVCIRDGGCDAADVLSGDGATVGVRGKGAMPAIGVSWKAADTYCRWIGARLPTEAELEFATRGAEGRRFTWGDTVRCNVLAPEARKAEEAAEAERKAVDEACAPVIARLKERLGEAGFSELSVAVGRLPPARVAEACTAMKDLDPAKTEAEVRALAATAPAVAAPPSTTPCGSGRLQPPRLLADDHPLGLSGLTGNVREWVADDYDPRGAPPLDGPRKVTKGGSYASSEVELRAAARVPLAASTQQPDVGFRCAWSAP